MRRSEENGSRFWWTGSVVQTLKGELVEGTVVAIVVWMMWGVVWYGKWKGGFYFFFDVISMKLLEKKLEVC